MCQVIIRVVQALSNFSLLIRNGAPFIISRYLIDLVQRDSVRAYNRTVDNEVTKSSSNFNFEWNPQALSVSAWSDVYVLRSLDSIASICSIVAPHSSKCITIRLVLFIIVLYELEKSK